ncbi:MAG: hypothetical protein AAGI24_09950 [Pseudomonadota bacterium]
MRLPLVYWLIAIAVVANVAAWYWRSTEVSSAVSAQADIGNLRLLSELSTTPQVQAAASRPDPGPPPPVLELGTGATPTEEPAPIRRQSTEAADEQMPASDAVPVAAAEMVAAVSDPEIEQAPAADEENVSVPEPATPPRCWWVGPVANEALSETLQALFAAAGISMDLVLRTIEVDPEHWVYLPTQGSQANIRRLSRTMRQEGIDNFPITDGPLAGSLSLGLFRSGERAQAYRDSIVSQGYGAKIYLRPAFAEQPWAALSDDNLVVLGWPQAVGEPPGLSEVQLMERDCPRDGNALQLENSLSRLAALGREP